MITSLRSSAARASTISSGYICLACRAKHQLTEVSSRRASTHPPPAPSSEKNEEDTPDDAVTKAAQLAIQDAFLKAFAQAKLCPPAIPTQHHGKTGYTASIDLGDKKIETQMYKTGKIARTKAKILAIEHIRKRSLQTDAAASIALTTLSPSSSEKKPALSRRKDLRGKLKEGSNCTDAAAKPTTAKKVSSKLEIRKTVTAHDRPSVRQRRAEREQRLEAARKRLAEAKAPEREPSAPPAAQTAHTSTRRSRLARQAPDSPPIAGRRGERAKRAKVDLRTLADAHTIRPMSLKQVNLDVPTHEVPGLSYGLDRVLFNPGVYHVQDPRSRVYNFDPYLEKIIDPRNFDFAVLDEYRTPSADNTLSGVAGKHKVKYFSSTSAITPVLAHLHFLLSNWRPLSFDNLSIGFFASRSQTSTSEIPEAKGDFTKYSKSPQSIYLKPKQGGYAIDRAEDKASTGLLSFVGQCLEKLFTVPKEVFESYKKGSTAQKPEPMSNGYHYTKFDSILVRSQLDAHDDRLPGTGIFDIKTRAVLPIRMDSLETSQEMGKNYEIKTLYGEFESFEREFYDMSRATMMKYSLQARLGRMDGIFVAYHNIARMFGFQYLSTADMDRVLHGQTDPALGDAEMMASLRILADVFDHAVKIYPNEPLRLYFETRKSKKDMNVYVVPVTEDEINEQHENSQRQSREYLARLNKPDKNTDDADDGEEELLSEVEKADFADDAKPQLDEDSWLSGASSDSASLSHKNEPDISTEELVGIDSVRDEMSRLFEVATKINMETDVLQKQSGSPKAPQVRKMMLSDIANKTFRFGKDVDRVAAMLKQCDRESIASEEFDVERLRKILDQQLKTNEKLYAQASKNNVLTGTEIKDMTNAQTLEAVLRTTSERYTAPARLAAFRVRAQSTIDGDITAEPPKVTQDTDWELTYTVTDYENGEEARQMYIAMLRKQGEAAMKNWESKRLREYYEGGFFQQLMRISRQGKSWRMERDRLDRDREVVVFEPRG